MSNRVIAGDHQGSKISGMLGIVQVQIGFKSIQLSSETVKDYEVITEEHRKSAKSGVGRGIIGGALLGPVGMIGGALSAKNKGTYQLAIQFKDGAKSLIEVDDKIYKSLMKSLF